MNYIAIEKYKLYYFMPSYWKKLRRVCDHCNKRNNIQSGKVNTGRAFDKSEPKKYWHRSCYFYSSSKEEL